MKRRFGQGSMIDDPAPDVGPDIEWNAGARLDRLPICRFHYHILALIGSGLLLDSLDIYVQGPLLAYFLATGWSDVGSNANFLSATFTGLVVGTLVSGRLSDLLGRRTLYRANLLLFGFTGLAASCAPSPTVLIVCRLLMGVGLGGEVVVGYGMLAEFVPPAVRGRLAGRLALISNLGIPVSAIICSSMMPLFGWRPVLAAIAILAGLVWIWQASMPESPRWLASVNRPRDADRTLWEIEEQVARQSGVRLPAPAEALRSCTIPHPIPGIRVLFQRNLIRRTLLAISLMVSVNVTVYSLTGWLPTILLRRGITIDRTLGATWLIQLGALPGSLVGAWAAERFGRRQSMINICLAAAIACTLFGLAGSGVALIGTGFITFALSYALVAIAFAIYVPEIFPTAIRMTGAGFSNACGRTANIFVPQAIPWMLLHLGANSIFFAISALLAMQAIIVWILGEDTRRRTLEEIAEGPACRH